MMSLIDINQKAGGSRIVEIFKGIFTPELYQIIYLEILTDQNFSLAVTKNNVKNTGLVYWFNEEFIEKLVVRMIWFLSEMPTDTGNYLDQETYHANNGIQQMSENIQGWINKQTKVSLLYN